MVVCGKIWIVFLLLLIIKLLVAELCFPTGTCACHAHPMGRESCRKALEDTDYKVHFDYFSIDYAEELSALSGGVLEQQAEFAAHCVQKILQLYAKKSPAAAKSAATSQARGDFRSFLSCA